MCTRPNIVWDALFLAGNNKNHTDWVKFMLPHNFLPDFNWDEKQKRWFLGNEIGYSHDKISKIRRNVFVSSFREFLKRLLTVWWATPARTHSISELKFRVLKGQFSPTGQIFWHWAAATLKGLGEFQNKKI